MKKSCKSKCVKVWLHDIAGVSTFINVFNLCKMASNVKKQKQLQINIPKYNYLEIKFNEKKTMKRKLKKKQTNIIRIKN